MFQSRHAGAAIAIIAGVASSCSPGHAAPKSSEAAAMAILKRVEMKMIGLKTYQADCLTSLLYPASATRPASERRERSHLVAAKPNRMRYDLRYMVRDPRSLLWINDTKRVGITFVCDGVTNWKQFGDHFRTDTRVAPEDLSTILEPWDGFYHVSRSIRAYVARLRQRHEVREVRTAGVDRIQGVLCDKVFVHTMLSYGGESQECWQTWYIGRDGLVRLRLERIDFGGKPGYKRADSLKNIVLNKPIPSSRFIYKPPKGVLSEAEYERAHPRPALLAAGAQAPAFTAKDATGSDVKLADFAGKVVVVDFWASWCGPCMASMPHNQEVAKKLQAEGLPVVFLAVDNGEERGAFDAWVKSGAGRYPALRFMHVPPKTDVSGDLYHVSGIPTQYVLDASGVIRASFVGYGGPTDDLEKAIRAALPHKE